MNTKNIFRTLFMAVLLLVGANSAKADEIVVWEGSASNGNIITVDKNKFQSAGENTKLCLYFSGGDWGFQYAVAINNRHDANNYTNWEGFSYNDTKEGGQQNSWNGKANTPIDGHFELILSTTGAEEIKKGGLEINSINGLTFTKITYIPGENSPAPTTHNITTTSSNGTITANPTSAAEGATITLTFTPDLGYELNPQSISVVDENNQLVTFSGSGNTRTFLMPASNVTVSASFVASVYSISVSSVSNGSITANPTSATMGKTVTLTISPNSGYELGSLSVVNGNGTAIQVSGTGNTRTFTMPASNVTVTGNFVKERTYVPATITSSTGYATFCSTEPLDFSGITTLKAYYAAAVSDTAVTFKRITGAVAAGTGLLLKGETTQILVTESGTAYEDNLLKGGPRKVNAANLYVLVEKDGVAKFADTAGNEADVPAGKAYLEAPTSNSRMLSFRFDDEATSISTVTTVESQPSGVYNLQGQRVTTAKKGLYIINGKKVVIK